MTTATFIAPPELQICNSTALTCDAAATLICQCGATERLYQSRLTRNRILLGSVLQAVRDRELWRGMGCKNWLAFLRTEFPRLSGLSERTAYDALSLQPLSALPSATLDTLDLSQARHLAYVQRTGGELTPEVVAQVVSTPAKELRRSHEGNSVVRLMTDSERTAALQRIVEALAPAHPLALAEFAALLESDAVQAYAGGTELPDFLLGVLATCALQEIQEAYAAMCEALGSEHVAALESHGWRCVACGKFLPLQLHHIRFRSHGGGDEPSNLEPRCAACHDRIHRGGVRE